MEEIWKPIKGYEGFYEISSLCHIRSLSRKVKSKSIGFAVTKERILEPWMNKSVGYYMVTLYKHGKSRKLLVHRLYAEAFIPNPDNKPCIDHINGIRSDNSIENLRWCTYKENNSFPLSIERRAQKMAYKSKRVAQIEPSTGMTIKEYRSTGEVERQTGYSRSTISSCCRGENLTSHGYNWKYID